MHILKLPKFMWVAALSTIIILTHCAQKPSPVEKSTSASTSSNGSSLIGSGIGGSLQGGDGYSGKPTYDLKSARTCADGQPESTIVADSAQSQYMMSRSNCLPLAAPQTLPQASVSLSSQGYYLAYQSHIYLSRALPADPARQSYSILCTGSETLNNSGQITIRTTLVHVVKYLTATGYRLTGLSNIQSVLANTGAIDNLSALVDNLLLSVSAGLSRAGGVNSTVTSGFEMSSSASSAFSPVVYARIPYTLQAVRGTGLNYSNAQFTGSISANSGQIALTCDQFAQ